MGKPIVHVIILSTSAAVLCEINVWVLGILGTIPLAYAERRWLRRKATRIDVIVKSAALLMLHDTITIHPQSHLPKVNRVILIPMAANALVPRKRTKIMAEITRVV
jgi:hypothetical protein